MEFLNVNQCRMLSDSSNPEKHYHGGNVLEPIPRSRDKLLASKLVVRQGLNMPITGLPAHRSIPKASTSRSARLPDRQASGGCPGSGFSQNPEGGNRRDQRHEKPERQFAGSGIHQGGSAEPERVRPEERRLAVAAMRALGPDSAALNTIRSDERGSLLCEMNASPCFEGIETATAKTWLA